jgi:conjugal transfer/type IV secretion protein DotA/TraY
MMGSLGNGQLGAAFNNAGSMIGNGLSTIGNGATNTLTAATNGVGYAGNSILRGTLFGFSGGQNDPMAVPAMDSLNRLGILLSVAGQVFDSASQAAQRNDSNIVKTTLNVGKAVISLASDNPLPMIKMALQSVAESMLESGSQMLHMATFAINAAAMFHLVILPMLPNIFSLVMAGEWIMWVVTALVAGPLWGVMHVLPGGNEEVIHPRTFHGWGLMGFILLYPVIVVIGYGASIMLFNTIIPLAGYMLTAYMPDGLVNSTMYLVFGLPTIGFVMAMLAWIALSLILQLPNLIAGWIGIRPESWFTQQATQHMTGMVPNGNVAQAAGVLTKSRGVGNSNVANNRITK